MGKPKRRKDQRPEEKKERRKLVTKDFNIHIRVTEAQKRAITAAAEKTGLTASGWMLMIALREIEKAAAGGSGG